MTQQVNHHFYCLLEEKKHIFTRLKWTVNKNTVRFSRFITVNPMILYTMMPSMHTHKKKWRKKNSRNWQQLKFLEQYNWKVGPKWLLVLCISVIIPSPSRDWPVACMTFIELTINGIKFIDFFFFYFFFLNGVTFFWMC